MDEVIAKSLGHESIEGESNSYLRIITADDVPTGVSYIKTNDIKCCNTMVKLLRHPDEFPVNTTYQIT